MIDPISIPRLLVAIFLCFLGFFVFLKKPQSRLHLVFLIFALTSTIWLATYCFAYRLPLNAAQFIFKFGFSAALAVPVCAFHFSSCYIGLKRDAKSIYIYYGVLFLFIFLTWVTGWVIQPVPWLYSWGYYPRAGFLHPVYLLFLAVIAGHFNVLLYRHYVQAKESKNITEEKRAKFVFLGICLYCLAPIDYLQNYGIEIFPFGFLFAGIYATMMAYAILRHQLLDIEVIIRRTAVFAGLFAFVYSTFTIVTILGQEFFENALGWNQWIAMIPTVVIITFALRPLEIFLTNATERFLFQKKYDYRELLRLFTNEILTVLDLQKLMEQTVAGLNNIIKVESACVLLLDQETKRFKIVASMGVKEKGISFSENDMLIKYLKASSQHIIHDQHAEKMEAGELKESFKKLNAKLCLPIELHDNLIGIICLGMKKSGEDYTQEDIDILTTLARTEAIAISNAQLFDELSKTQAEAAQREKMAVIGTLAAGINHEICNPLGIVRGQCEMFLLNMRDGFYEGKTKEEMLKLFSEILNKAIKETDRATAITKKLSSFAKPPSKAEREEVFVEHEVDEVMSLIGHDMKLSNIDVQKDFPDNFPLILADRKQIQEVLFNIIRNAAQAIDPNKRGRIVVSGFSEKDDAVIRIADNGAGIPQEKLAQIFHPFYTTKAPGKGTGLGLFIVKQVVERNQGTIAVESEFGVGTTFTLRFPTALHAIAHN